MASAQASIVASGVSYLYPGTRALDDVSFSVEAGSVTALVGPNGAGKTTLLRCLAGLERPLAGAIRVAGIDVLEEPREAHAEMGYLSDFFGLYEHLSVQQCLRHAASAHGVPAAQVEATVAATARRLGLGDRLEARCNQLSRGLRQRVAIGQAIVHAPRVLLLDEPASGLDPEARHALAALFTALRAEGMTLVVSSHILAELDEYCTHMMVLREGRLLEHRSLHGDPDQGRRVRVVAQGTVDWAAVLAGVGGCELRAQDAQGASLLIGHGEGEAARVLRALVLAGVPVAAFGDDAENLHQSYLRSVAPSPAEARA